MGNNEKSLRDLIAERRQRYDSTKNTYCPFLKEVVYFNNKGFFHATHDGRDHIRSEADARMRLNLLLYVTYIIENAKSFSRPPQLVPKNAADNKTGKELVHYELICRVGKNRQRKKDVIVVLRRIGNGRLHYYSVRYAKKQNRPRGSA